MTKATSRRPLRSALQRSWTPEDSAELYQVRAWGKGYFAVNSSGHMVVRPDKVAGEEIDLPEVVEHLRKQGTSAPLLLRFTNLLSHRLREMHDAFATAISENDYRGGFFAVYPIKVNQQRSVVEEVYRYGSDYRFGLEVGSKPELLAVMAMSDDTSPRLVVCNGFKDDDYIKTVILASKLGRSILPVVEKLDELSLILRHAEAHGVRPRIGVRLKLTAPGAGRWRDSAGAKSKFGLFVSEVLELLEELESHGMADCLELLHCHAGSQLHDIRRIKDAVGELAHVYVELTRLGATGLRFLDVGGGLGVDYDGSQTNFASSMNYTLAEYAGEIVYRVATICEEAGVAHPTIVTESGRAMAAYQSLLIVNVLGRSGLDGFRVDEDLDAIAEGDTEVPQPILDLVDAARSLSERRAIECYHDAIQAHEQALNLFGLGYLPLEWRAFADRLFWSVCARIRDITRRMPAVPEELEKLETILADIYFCNFSVFQSLPDSWAIHQLFPIAPIHRLSEKPDRKAILADMTCDSDGKIDRFVDLRDIQSTLAVHDLVEGEDYYLAIFLVGAYQETLGDLHNLFGDTHVVHLRLEEDGSWQVGEVVEGDTAAEVLSYLQYDVEGLGAQLEVACQRAVAEGRMNENEARALLAYYDGELHGYTYLEPEAGS
ncbi:MAG: biosynthetic arginine decarboxylase [Thermoanaerobaculia bacterium]